MTSSGGHLMETTLMTIDISVTDIEDNNNMEEESSGQQQLMVDMECPNCKVSLEGNCLQSDEKQIQFFLCCCVPHYLTCLQIFSIML